MEKPKKPKTKGELETELAEREADILRLHADFENYKKHLDKEKAAFAATANEGLIKDMLCVLDSFELAIPQIKDPAAKKGFELIYCQLKKILEDFGLRRIEAKGKKLDPYYHEVMLGEDSDKEDDVVLEELQSGYMLKDRVIRHSKVKIAKNNKGEAHD
jgi:molecular chaperone GrpE